MAGLEWEVKWTMIEIEIAVCGCFGCFGWDFQLNFGSGEGEDALALSGEGALKGVKWAKRCERH